MEFSYLNHQMPSKDLTGHFMPNGINNESSDIQRLAAAYVNFQYWEEPFGEEEAFRKGTVFPSLSLPFEREGR